MAHDTPWPLALSTWSIHRAIGTSFPDTPAREGDGRSAPTWGPGSLSVMEVPDRIAALGIGRLEICSFHIDRRDHGFLEALRGSIAAAGVTLQTLLIDDGDITDPLHGARDTAWIGEWIDVAARLGAEKVRVIAGKQQPSPDVLDRSVAGLAELARRGGGLGVRVITENWHATMAGPREVHAVLDRLDGAVGFLADFGNWSGPTRFADLASVLPRAENSHLHCRFDNELTIDAEDLAACLAVARRAAFGGPLTLIYDGTNPDEWSAVKLARDQIGGAAFAAVG